MSSISEMVKDYVPHTWQYPYKDNHRIIPDHSQEFRNIQQQLGLNNISRITRIQNIYSYGQFLIRSQLLIASSNERHYQVRRFIKFSRYHKDDAIKYNLDPRRCSLASLQFSKTIPSRSANEIVAVVQVVTNNQNAAYITPTNSLEYYVEYIVEFH